MEKWDLDPEVALGNMKTKVFLNYDKFDLNIIQLHEELDIKSEDDANVKSTDDVVVVDSVPQGKILKQEVLHSNEEKGLLHMKAYTNGNHAHMDSKNENIINQLNSVTSKSSAINDKPSSTCRSKQLRCEGCNATFNKKTYLDRHTLRKHPQFISSVTSKIHECKICTYKTTEKHLFDDHMRKHSGEPSYKVRSCVYCNERFSTKLSMDNHVLRKHPTFIDTVTSKVHECKFCIFKTTNNTNFKKHLLKHPETNSSYKFGNCNFCQAKLIKKEWLGEHILRSHPNFIESITSKIYKCQMCNFKTTITRSLNRHLLLHPATEQETESKTEYSIDNDILKRQTESIESLTSKLHVCSLCDFKTTIEKQLDNHMLKHHEARPSVNTIHLENMRTEVFLDNNKFDLNITQLHEEVDIKSDEHVFGADRAKIEPVEMEKWATYDLEQIVTLENMKTEVPFDDDEFDYNINVRQLYPEVGIKSENDESVNFTHDVVVVNSVPLGQILKEEDDILYGNEEKGLLNCYHCNYSADHRISLIDHMKSHMNEKHAYMYSENENIIDQPNSVTTKSSTINDKPFSKSLSFVSSKQLRCEGCDVTFSTKTSLDRHTLRKHPQFISSITSKIRECKICTYKAITKYQFDEHMRKHSGEEPPNKFRSCIHCNARFASKRAMDNHVFRKHPKFIETVTNKIYECKICTYKAITKFQFVRHMRKHSGEKPPTKFISCIHCNARFASKRTVDDHVIRKHPKFVETVTSKIHQCKFCIYKTTVKSCFRKHMQKHGRTNSSYKFNNCNFPEGPLSCYHCNYSADDRTSLIDHMKVHTNGEKPPNKFISCTHCNARFASKRTVDDHVLRKHPKFIETVTSKIYECTFCIYKTTANSSFRRHLQKHGRTSSSVP